MELDVIRLDVGNNRLLSVRLGNFQRLLDLAEHGALRSGGSHVASELCVGLNTDLILHFLDEFIRSDLALVKLLVHFVKVV